jgi:pyruvate formate lyase activating enzyme
MKEAMLYEIINKDLLKCKVCNHYCLIKNNSRGICGVRQHIDGVMFALNYGLTIARAIDPIEKKPIYHYLPRTSTYSFATVGCNLSCAWCQNWDISQSSKKGNPIRGKYISPEEHIEEAVKNKCESISYTYSEPTIFLEYAYDVMKLAHEKGLKNIWVTNGFMSKETLELILPLVDAFNVDLKGLNNHNLIRYCGGKINPVLDNLITIYQRKKHLEITTLVVTGVNDSLQELSDIADFIINKLGVDVPWHITRFYPGYKMLNVEPTKVEILKKAREIAIKKGIKHVHIGNIF